MDDKILESMLEMYKPEVRFLKSFYLLEDNKAIGTFSGIGRGNTYHLKIGGDHFNNIPAYISYNQFAIAFYSEFFEKKGFSLQYLKNNFLKMYVIQFSTRYKRTIEKEYFQGEFIHRRTIESRKNLFILKNEYSFDDAFFGEGVIAVDLR